MKGTNPIRKPVMDGGRVLDIQSVFPTLQGEGPNAGVPAVFVRLGGCNLACDFCDTEFESFNSMKLNDVVARVVELAARSIRLVVITGGEPLRQNIAPLCESLLAKGFAVQIETNGTLFRSLPEGVEIVCSPKNTGQGYFPIRPDLLPMIGAFKFIISARHPDYHDVPQVGQGTTPIYVQPMDEADGTQNAANVARARMLAQQHGYRLSLQLHKILGIE